MPLISLLVLTALQKAPPKQPEWAGTLGISVISLSGNAETITGAVNLNAERKSNRWVWGTKAFAAYGQTRPAEGGEAQVVALNAGLNARGDRRFSEKLSVFLGAGGDTDHLKSVEYRYFGEGGASVTWLERKIEDYTQLFLRTDLGLRYAQESRFQYFPVRLNVDDITLLAPRLALSFRYLFEKNVGFFQEAEVLPNVLGASRLIVNTTSKLSARLTEEVALGVTFDVRYDSAPAAGKKPTDTALMATLEVGF
jgi:putative salt-induced outer membrane protein YdiY